MLLLKDIMTKKINFAVIGYGKMGHLFHECLSNIQGIHVQSFYDPNVAESGGLRKVEQVEQILSDTLIDAVVITTPNFKTCEYVSRALKAGKNVFSEKPAGLNSDEARKILETSKNFPHLKLKLGFNHRYLSSVVHAKEIINSGNFGKILWLRGRYGKGGDDEFYNQWRSKKEMAGGGILLDQGIHMLDLGLFFCSAFDEVHAFIENLRFKKANVEDNAFVMMKNNQGQVFHFHSSMTQWKHMFSLDIGMEHGLLVLQGILSSTKSYGDETLHVYKKWKNNFCEEQVFHYHNEDFYTLIGEMNDFVRHIREDTSVENGSIADAVKVMELIDKIYQTA